MINFLSENNSAQIFFQGLSRYKLGTLKNCSLKNQHINPEMYDSSPGHHLSNYSNQYFFLISNS